MVIIRDKKTKRNVRVFYGNLEVVKVADDSQPVKDERKDAHGSVAECAPNLDEHEVDDR